jgi:hypothetical protein
MFNKFRRAASAARHSTFTLALSLNVQHFSQSCFSCAAFHFGLEPECAALFAELLQLRGIHLRLNSLQFEPECPARFAELLHLRGILLWSSWLQLEPECSALFAELLQLRGILLRPSSLQLEPECSKRFESFFSSAAFTFGLEPVCQHFSRSCLSSAAFFLGLARSNLSLNVHHVSQNCFSCAAFFFGPARSYLILNVQHVTQSSAARFRGIVTAVQHSTSALSHRVVHSTEKPSLLHLASKN